MAMTEVKTGKRYEYQICFNVRGDRKIELKLYSDFKYTDFPEFLKGDYIEEEKNLYIFKYQGKQIVLNKEEITDISFYVMEL